MTDVHPTGPTHEDLQPRDLYQQLDLLCRLEIVIERLSRAKHEADRANNILDGIQTNYAEIRIELARLAITQQEIDLFLKQRGSAVPAVPTLIATGGWLNGAITTTIS